VGVAFLLRLSLAGLGWCKECGRLVWCCIGLFCFVQFVKALQALLLAYSKAALIIQHSSVQCVLSCSHVLTGSG
jgi:hypothetical protein